MCIRDSQRTDTEYRIGGNKVNRKGILIVVSGFSGSGKGTLMKELLSRYPDTYALSVSATTRQPRDGEQDGREYFFISKDEFEKIINESKPTIVDFFATWCGPCKMLSPILEKVEEDSKGEFNIVKIDVDESYDVAKKYGIMSVPTMIIFKDGDEQEKIVGLRQKNQIEDAVRNYID